jgi:GT2 family glycosyltransferase
MTIRALESLSGVILKNPFDVIHNILLVDNGSTEDQLKNVEKKAAELNKNKIFDIRITSITPNRGFGGGMNHGLRECFSNGADKVLALSNDVEIDGDFFINVLKINNGNAVLCPHTYFLMDKTKPSYSFGEVHFHENEPALSHGFDLSKKEIVFPFYYPAAALIWSKSAFEKSGGFNEIFYCYWEDVELSLRLSKLGVPLISDPSLKIYHLGRGTTAGKKSYFEHFLKGKEIIKKMIT